MTIIDILESIENAQGRIEKENILREHKDNDLLFRTLTAALDPYVDYGVKKYKKQKPSDTQSDDDVIIEDFLTLLEQCFKRELVGNAAKDAISKYFTTLNHLQQKWCDRILLKRIRCGVQLTTVNKIWPNSVKKFEVALAKTLKTNFNSGLTIIDNIEYPVRLEPKLDGLRLIVMKVAGVVSMYTRNGNKITTLASIEEAVKNNPIDNIVLDGEAMGSDWNESASIMMSYKNKKNDVAITFNVFDIVSWNDWLNKTNDEPYTTRLSRLEEFVSKTTSDCIKIVDGIIANDEAQLRAYYASSLNNHYEGIMLKSLNEPYTFKRSNAILKMKPEITYEGVVVDYYKGRDGTKLQEGFGGFKILLPNNIVTNVGSGFSDEERSDIYDFPNSYIGKIIEVKGQPDPETDDGLTKDGKIRFPVFVRYRDEGDVDQSLLKVYQDYLNNISYVN